MGVYVIQKGGITEREGEDRGEGQLVYMKNKLDEGMKGHYE